MLDDEHLILGPVIWMGDIVGPLIFGTFLILFGAISLVGRRKLSHGSAKASVAFGLAKNQDRAQRGWLRYGVVSGWMTLTAGSLFVVWGLVQLVFFRS